LVTAGHLAEGGAYLEIRRHHWRYGCRNPGLPSLIVAILLELGGVDWNESARDVRPLRATPDCREKM